MPAKDSPFLDAKYGWSYGENGWNSGMDENILKFSFMFDGNVNGIVSSLPPIVDGEAYFLTTDSNFYFAAGLVWYFVKCPDNFVFKIKSTGDTYLFNGTTASPVPNNTSLDSRLDAVELTVSSLGTAAFEDTSYFTPATFITDLANISDITKGSTLVGYRGRTVKDNLDDYVNVKSYGAVGDGVADDTAAFTAAITDAAAKGKSVWVPATTSSYVVGNLTLSVNLFGDGRGSKVLRKSGTTGAWITITATYTNISGMQFDGNFVSGDGIEINAVDEVKIYNNIFTRIGGLVVHFNGANRLSITGNTILNCTDGISNRMPDNSTSEIVSRGVSVCDNKINTVAGSGIYFAGEHSSTDPLYYFSHFLIVDGNIRGNTLNNVSGHGILVESRRTSILGNQLIGVGNSSGLQSIVCQGDMITVVGNAIEGGSGVGIDMGGCKNSSVTGNSVRSKGEIGIELNSCTNMSCTANVVEACGANVTGTNSAGINISQGFFGPTLTSSAVTVVGNSVTPGPTPGKYGISVDGGAVDVQVIGNHLTGAGTIAPLYLDATSRALFLGNITGNNEESLAVLYGTNNKFVSRSASGNSDFWMSPQGTGQLRVDKTMTTATTPASFSAQARIQIKDSAGTVYWIPVTTTAW